MGERNLTTYKALLSQGYGLILVTGPTGSGKTTSLYAALNYLNSLDKSIVTIEDPVEYQIEVVNQNEVRDRIGLTFAMMLKHVLRQDPDIVMVGEIREKETAEIAVQAALTGHLVLSTLHTNDSVGAITRMIDMGVEPYLLSSALIGVIAQRLVRTICPSCKTTYVADKEMVTRFGWSDERSIRLARGRGCNECYDSGFKGRLGIHEALTMDAQLQRMIVNNPGKDALMAYVKEHELPMLFDDGLERVLQQQTTIEEISRVISVHGG
jgi:type IV pilus assembly protein PilB